MGKTTLSRQLVRALKKQGIPAVSFEDYERRKSGYNAMKSFIKSQTSLEARFLFYISSAVYKSELITELLKTQWVVCDRYIYSTLAHHQAHNPRIITTVNLQQLPIRWPDYYFLVTVPDVTRLRRVRQRGRSTKADLMRKLPSTFSGRMERYLRSYQPIVLDNSSEVSATIDRMLQILHIERQPLHGSTK